MHTETPARKYSVLIADDNQNNLRVLSSMLEQMGYRVRAAKSGELTLQSVALEIPDIILLDIHMSGMDGYEVCRRLKKQDGYRDIPVIFVSALSEMFNKQQAFLAGGIDYITKPFEMEEVQLRVETHLRLRENARQLQDALDRLSRQEEQLVHNEKMAALGVLTAGIAHEINNPVNYISNSITALEHRLHALRERDAGALISPDLAGEMEELVQSIHTGVSMIAALMTSLRIYARTERETEEYASVTGLMDAAILLLHHRCKDRISISTYYASVPPLRCQPGKLSQVFISVLSNAIDAIDSLLTTERHANRRGLITVRVEPGKDEIIITVIDNGCGMSGADCSRAFDPFFTTKLSSKGTGLGLSISQSIIEEHGGSITIESVPETETSVTMRLPIKEDADA